MNNSEVLEKLKAYLKCQKRQVKGIYEDCNENLCDNCDLCYAQGNAGEHIEAVEVAVQAFEKLSDYEDLEELTGISIKELAKIFRQHIHDGCQHPKKAIVLTDGDVDKWRKYKDLEEQGRLIKLPCKVGDTVWDNDFGIPCAYTITAFSFGECEEYICEPITTKEAVFYYANSSGSITGSFAESEIGKSVFLSKAEAKANLKELSCKENSKDI